MHALRILTASLLLTVASAQPDAASDEQILKSFVSWLSSQRLDDNFKGIVDAYNTHLKSKGLSDGEITRQEIVLRKLMRTRSDGWKYIFDSVYTATNPQFDTKPNALLMSAVEGRTPGRAVDAGMGQGRNSVFLALKGWEVTALTCRAKVSPPRNETQNSPG